MARVAVGLPKRTGEPRFGDTLLTRASGYELGAEVDLTVGDEGLVCVLAPPLGTDVDVTAH